MGQLCISFFFQPAARYSEDIDLVRTTTGPIKKIVDRLTGRLDSWLGNFKSIRTSNSFKLNYYFSPETVPHAKLKVKLEINIRECFSCFETTTKKLSVNSKWFEKSAMIRTYQFPELIATKLRALYQRKKGRDVFDLWLALKHEKFNLDDTLKAFQFYIDQENNVIRKKDFLLNLENKLKDSSFIYDMAPLLMFKVDRDCNKAFDWNIYQAVAEIKDKIILKLPT